MMQKVLVIGYGSIGKRHVENLVLLGFEPYVLTSYPDESKNVKFIKSLDECTDANYTVIATPTSQHLRDFINLTQISNCKSVFIDKPVDMTLEKSLEIKKEAEKLKIDVFIGYNMRFIKVFESVKEYITNYLDSIRLVKIFVGQYLPEWRSYKDYRDSYSSHRESGGGVDLDLSHEVDYMIWLFGLPKLKIFTMTDKISDLEINSPDYFKGIYKYSNFLVDVELDYFREKERKLRIIGENKDIINVDFINHSYKVFGDDITQSQFFNFDESYIEELKEFLGLSPTNKLATLSEGIDVLKLLRKD